MVELVFCPKCGAETADDAAFCPSCGNKITVSPAAVERRRAREEKREKSEKGEKEEKEEKSTDKTGALVGGLILIWLGITFFLAQAHYIVWDEWWPYFVIGVGVILILQGLIRYSTSRFRGPMMGSLIAGVALLIIGLAGIAGMNEWWPFVLIAIGVVVILVVLTARARTPKPI